MEILDLSEWKYKDEKGNLILKGLITSTIWISKKRIIESLETYEYYGLEKFITANNFRKSKKKIIALINQLIDRNEPIVINEKLHQIFLIAPSILKNIKQI